MKEIPLISFVRSIVEDNYVMNVFYYSIKKSFVERGFSLHGYSYIKVDGRFLGNAIKVCLTGNYRTSIHSLSLLLSVRLLMLNPKCIELCENSNLIFLSKPTESFQWINYIYFIMEYWDDPEIKMLYQMMEDYFYDEAFTEEEKEEFMNSIFVPEYRNEKKYYQYLADITNGVSDNVIGNNAFIESDIEEYTISKDIVYIGNTAFSYCNKLETLIFEGKTMFGTFPIIECTNLKHIVVPSELKEYYKKSLPYYKDIVSNDETISDG